MEKLAFHSLILLPILTISLLYISLLEGWENVLFELGSERVKQNPSLEVLTSQENEAALHKDTFH